MRGDSSYLYCISSPTLFQILYFRNNPGGANALLAPPQRPWVQQPFRHGIMFSVFLSMIWKPLVFICFCFMLVVNCSFVRFNRFSFVIHLFFSRLHTLMYLCHSNLFLCISLLYQLYYIFVWIKLFVKTSRYVLVLKWSCSSVTRVA